MPHPTTISLLMALLVLAGPSARSAVSATPAKPNIIFFLADDLGYMDLVSYAARVRGVERTSCFYETPQLDQLADQGVVFTQAYAASLCSPTRASLITGTYAARQGFMTATPGQYKTHYNQGIPAPEGFYAHDGLEHKTDRPFWPLTQGLSNIALPLRETTIAEALPGYHSAFIGKWHLGGHGSAGFSPAAQGFEEIAWFDSGGSPYFNWRSLWNNPKKMHPAMDQDVLQQGDAGEETGEAYLTDDLAVQACRFIERQAGEAQPFFLYFCQFAVHSPFQAKDEDIRHFTSKKTRGWNGHANPTYAGMLKAMDDCVGSVRDALESSGQADNTIIVFMSDNGGIVHPDENGRPTISNNAPLKGEKALLVEGGIRVPLFIWYPEKLKPAVCDVPVDCNDIFPTLLELAGAAAVKGDGESLVPLLQAPENAAGEYGRDTFFWHYPFYVSVGLKKGDMTGPSSAVRKGDWKLILRWEGRLELYNIKEDRSELHDRSGSEPERTAALFRELTGWLNETVETRYIPRENPRYDPGHVEARGFQNMFERDQLVWPRGCASRAD